MSPSRREFLSTIGPLAPLAWTQPDLVWNAISDAVLPTGRLALVVGHTRLRPGAYGIGAIGQHEYPFNTRLAEIITGAAKHRRVDVRTFYRDLGGVKHAFEDAFKWGADGVIELHFNATRKRTDEIRGTETFGAGGERIASFQLASALQTATLEVLERPAALDRGTKLARLRQEFDMPVALAEPVFGNNLPDAKLLVERQEAYARAVIDGFEAFLRTRELPQEKRLLPKDVIELPEHITA